jgi:transcriptional regulator
MQSLQVLLNLTEKEQYFQPEFTVISNSLAILVKEAGINFPTAYRYMKGTFRPLSECYVNVNKTYYYPDTGTILKDLYNTNDNDYCYAAYNKQELIEFLKNKIQDVNTIDNSTKQEITIVFEETTSWDSLSNETTEHKEIFGTYTSLDIALKAIETQKKNLIDNFPAIKGQYEYSYETHKLISQF